MDTGLLIIRLVVGLLFVGHGAQKLSHMFGGHGIEGTAGFFRQLGFRPPKAMAGVAGVTEVGAGVLLATGLLTPFAGAGIIGLMVVAAWVVNRANGLWISSGGFEYDLVLATVAASIAFTGPGEASLDHALDWNLAGVGWGVFAIGLGLVSAIAVLASRKPEPVAAPDDSAAVERELETQAS